MFSLVCGGGASALGLGEVSVDSSLNERFAASIPLLSVTSDQRDSVSVHIARIEDFHRAGIEWTDYLSTLRFRLLEGPEGTRVVIDSDEPLREPYLNFVVEADWGTGRLLREYTVLLDPPKELNLLPSSGNKAVSFEAAATPSPTANSSPHPQPIAVAAPPSASATAAAPPETAPAGESFLYGPVRPHEQPRAIAARLHPGPGVTQEQVELALYRANPHAFQHGRLDRMVPGAMLSIPPLRIIRGESAASARSIILAMRASLEPTRSAAAAQPRHVATPAAHPAATARASHPPAAAAAEPLKASALPAAATAPPAQTAAAAPEAKSPAEQANPARTVAATAAPPAPAAAPAAGKPTSGTLSFALPPAAGMRGGAAMDRRHWASGLWLASLASLLIGLGALLLSRRMRQAVTDPDSPSSQPVVARPAAISPAPAVPAPPADALQTMVQDAEFSQMSGHFADATRLLEAAVARAPEDKELRFRLAENYFAVGMRDDFTRTASALEGQLDEPHRQKLVAMLASLPPPAAANADRGPLAA